MYTPINTCTVIIHLLLKHPILVIAMGLSVATGFLNTQAKETPIEQIEQGEVFISKIAELRMKPKTEKLANNSPETFAHIVLAKSDNLSSEVQAPSGDILIWFSNMAKMGERNNWNKLHPDNISYGPTGLTAMAATDVLKETCDHYTIKEVLNNPELNLKYAYLYFLQMLHRFDDMKTAIIAYSYGPTRVARLIRKGKPLPEKYYNEVYNTKLKKREK